MYTVEQHGSSWRVMLGTAVVHEFGAFVLRHELGGLLYVHGPRDPQPLAIDYADWLNRQQVLEQAAVA